jgi:hypothetical protein
MKGKRLVRSHHFNDLLTSVIEFKNHFFNLRAINDALTPRVIGFHENPG